jgi:hypothetical protein
MNTHEPGLLITAALVRASLAGNIASVVQKHWVEVDGTRWPVTQAFALATGKPSVKSNRARRELQRLGFLVGQDAQPNPGTWIAPQPSKPAAPAFDQNTLEAQDSSELTFRYTWQCVGSIVLDEKGYPSFPSLPSAPGIYRFDFGIDGDGLRVVYIGEGKNVANRAIQYRNAKVDRKRALTSRRLHRAMVQHLQAGGEIEMSMVLAAHFADGSVVNFGQKSGRLLVESGAVVLAQLDPVVRAMNVDRDLGSVGTADREDRE